MGGVLNDIETIDHTPIGKYFIREVYGSINSGVNIQTHAFYVCHTSDGSFAGSASDGADVEFQSLREARNFIRSQFEKSSVLTTTEAATVLGVNTSRVRQLILSGRLLAEKIGRDWQIKRDDLDKIEREKPGPKPGAKPNRPHTEPGE